MPPAISLARVATGLEEPDEVMIGRISRIMLNIVPDDEGDGGERTGTERPSGKLIQCPVRTHPLTTPKHLFYNPPQNAQGTACPGPRSGDS